VVPTTDYATRLDSRKGEATMPKSKAPKIDMPTCELSTEAMLMKFDIEQGPSFEWTPQGVKATTLMKDTPMWAAETWAEVDTLRRRFRDWRNLARKGYRDITVGDCSGHVTLDEVAD
jgi:hypothetical protein